ncbi:phenylacetaldoxime dehydratase family protein [Actinoplanes sp. NPDC051851]|uniref:phenylacetaldoxime dehydratase family protein n=1 Tax=Actinoplanes sp. NPDC051851 TaxID=3154753 RepID=UPI00344857DD
MGWRPEYPRLRPARRPAGHQPRAPRWTVGYPAPFTAVVADYLAVQVPSVAAADEFRSLLGRAGEPAAPESSELLTTVDAEGLLNVVHLGYWTDAAQHARWVERSAPGRWFRSLDPAVIDFGAWHEVIRVAPDRAEMIFSDPRRPFGYAACPGMTIDEMTTNGYYGAARDRLPISAVDDLDAPAPHLRHREPAPSRGARLRAVTGLNTAVIRSGQHWERAEGDQLDDYLTELQPKLDRGMDHLAGHRDATGTMSLRVLTSVDPATLAPRRETSTLAYFHSLRDLEEWAESHATHAAIYEHAIAKNRQYGADRTVTTWHEVFVLPESSSYEYVNCHPGTGILEYATSRWTVLDD